MRRVRNKPPDIQVLDLDYLPLGDDTARFLRGEPVLSDVAMTPPAPVLTLAMMSREERAAIVAAYGPMSDAATQRCAHFDKMRGGGGK